MVEYKQQYDLVPAPYLVILEAMRRVNGWIVLPLIFAWALGVHRRWLILRQALVGK